MWTNTPAPVVKLWKVAVLKAKGTIRSEPAPMVTDMDLALTMLPCEKSTMELAAMLRAPPVASVENAGIGQAAVDLQRAAAELIAVIGAANGEIGNGVAAPRLLEEARRTWVITHVLGAGHSAGLAQPVGPVAAGIAAEVQAAEPCCCRRIA